MKIKQRMNSYPILSEISDDYINSSFTTDIAWYDIEKTKMRFNFNLDNKAIQKMERHTIWFIWNVLQHLLGRLINLLEMKL